MKIYLRYNIEHPPLPNDADDLMVSVNGALQVCGSDYARVSATRIVFCIDLCGDDTVLLTPRSTKTSYVPLLYRVGESAVPSLSWERRRMPWESDLPSVVGTMECSNADFERRCLLLLKEEQEKPLPNNALIAVLCDAVRMAREYTEAIQRPISRVDKSLSDSFDQKAHHFFGDHGDHT